MVALKSHLSSLSLPTLLFIITGLFFSQTVSAQYPIQITVNVMPPYPNYADEVIEMGDQTIITLQNTDINSGYSLKLGVELNGDNGIIVRSKENAMPNQSINIQPGETMVMTGDELSSFYNNYSESDFDFIGITKADIINDQQLPDGAYTVCVRAYDYNSGIPLSATSPQGCTPPFTVVAIDPPIITYPQDQMQVSVVNPQLLNINWIPVSIALPDLRYRLEMVDLTDMPVNVYDAFETGDFLFFYQDDIIGNTFIYGMESPLLIEGHEYAIRVRAYRIDGLLNVNNAGYSDIVRFTYGESTGDNGAGGNTGGEGVNGDEIFTASTLPDQNMSCGELCHFSLTGNETPISQKPQVGSMLNIGNFQLKITTISGSGTFNGTGVIQATGYIPVGIKVDFENIQVDSDGRVIAGKAKAKIRSGSWIDQTWADINTATENININTSDYGGDYQAATDPQYYIDNLETLYENVGTTIPISIGAEDNSLQIVGMNFFPDRASYNLSYILKLADDPSGERYLHFMAKDLCITPGGLALSADEARLELVKPFRYTFDNSTQLVFQPSSNGVAGTYLSFDCDGFGGIHAKGQAVFNPDVIKPVTSDGEIIPGDTVVASFMTNFVSWSDWVAAISFDTDVADPNTTSENLFMYKELDDYIIKVQNAFIDHSINSNPETMVFPENYQSYSGPEWQGVFFKTIEVDLPKWVKAYDDADKRVHLTGKNLIVDSQGLTGVIQASNVLSSKNGALGKWPVTIDSLQFKIQQNNLAQAFFSGGLKIPVIDEPFDYTADLQFLQGNTKHTFSFSPLDSYTIPSWFAETTLENNSALTVTIAQNKAFVEADLNGKISFSPVIGDIDKMNLTDITFEDLIIRSEKDPKYIEIGNIGTGVSAQSLAIAGFGITLNQLEWLEDNAENTGLKMDVGLDLADSPNPISGESGFFIKNEIEDFTDSIAFRFDGTKINDIHLAVETGAVDMDGTISFFRDDPKFGNGFDGSINLSFIKSISLDGTVMFGNTIQNNGNKLYYFYAYAMAYLPNSPVPMATPLDIYGFGGGVYYNLALDSDMPDPGAVGGTNVNPHEIFNVQQGILGLQASVVVGLTPSSRTFNADVTLSAEINVNDGGLNLIALTGSGYLMQKIDEPEKDQAMVTANVAIMYDFPKKTFQAKFGILGKIPKQNPLLTVSGDIEFYRSPTLWYLKAGVPKEPLTTSLDLGIAGIDATAYFMTGQHLPSPVLPPKVKRFFNFESHMEQNTQNDLGIGFMAGMHLDVDVNFELFKGTGVHIWAAAGADISLLNYFAATCGGHGDFGVNKWYAQGRGYIAGEFSLSVFKANIASLAIGMMVDGAFPNPTGINGKIVAEAKFLTTSVKINREFEFGSFCDGIFPVDDAENLVDHKEKELDNLEMIGVVTPASSVQGVSTSAKPTIQWFFENGEFKRYVYGDGVGGIIDKLYRIKNEAQWQIKTDNGSWTPVAFTAEADGENDALRYQAVNANGDPSLLHGSADYKITAKSWIEYYDGNAEKYGTSDADGTWIAATYYEGDNQGQPIKETVTHPFRTTTNLTEIDEMFVDYTLPYPRQRFYPYGYLHTGKIKFNVDQEPKFQDFEDCGFGLHAEFTPVISPGMTERKPVSRANLMQATYDMASLSPQTIYKLQIVAERKTTLEDIISGSGTPCGVNSAQSMNNFLNDFGLSADLENFQGAGNQINLGPEMPNSIGSNLGINSDSITQRKILYTLYFRTSKFETPQQKLNSLSVDGVNTVTHVVSLYPTPKFVKDVSITLDCGEGFDKYDLYGHDYQTGETMEYFRPYGPNCLTEGMEADVQSWFSSMCYPLNHYGSSPGNPGGMGGGGPGGGNLGQAGQIMQNMVDGQKKNVWKVTYASDPSNYTGKKYIKPLLSDAEVGIAQPATSGTFDPDLLPVIDPNDPAGGLTMSGGNTTGGDSDTDDSTAGGQGSGAGGWGYGGYSIGGYDQNGGDTNTDASGLDDDTPAGAGATLIDFSGDPELELVYNIDRHAYNIYDFLDSQGLASLADFTHPPTGTYPLSITFTNPANIDNPDFAGMGTKILNVSIPFQP